MNVLYVDLEQEWRGGQNQALLTLRGLRTRGHWAELVALGRGALAGRARAEAIPVHTVRGPARRLAAAFLLRGLLARRTFDLLHANEPHSLTAAWLAGAHHRLPVVVSRRVAYPLRQSSLAMKRYASTRRAFAISRFVQQSVLDSGLPAGQLELVYEGVEVPPPPSAEHRWRARERWGVAEGEPLIGCVGYLLPEKGQQFLVGAMPAVRARFPACRLLLAGDGRWRRRLERMVTALNLGSAVHFAGIVQDVSQVYAALDVFVFPSLAEPLGTSLLAAMAWGLPAVAVARGGVPEIIEDGRDGLLVPEPDAGRIAAAVTRLLDDPEEAGRLGGRARETIVRRFSADQMVENTLRAYAHVISPAERR